MPLAGWVAEGGDDRTHGGDVDEVRRRTDQALNALRQTLAATQGVRDAAREQGQETFAQTEDEVIANLERRIAWLEQQAAEFEERQAGRADRG